MKRRDFLALVSSVGVSATLGGLTFGPGDRVGYDAQDEPIQVRPQRQGVGHPVEVRVTLPEHIESEDLPELRVVREEVPGWYQTVDTTDVRQRLSNKSWTLSWVPPIVRPSAEEIRSELIRFRLVALDATGRLLCPVSGPVEVVCGVYGWVR